MSNIKLIAVDLDGTLLDSEHKISEYTVNLIHSLQARGIVFVPVTGRPLPAMLSAISSSMCDYSINTNGVHLYKHDEEQTRKLFDKSFAWLDAEQVFSYIAHGYPEVLIQAYVGEVLYATKQDCRTEEYSHRSGLDYVVLDNWNSIEGSNISKIMVLDAHEALLPVQKSIRYWSSVQAVFSVPSYLEIFSAESSKGNALRFLAETLNINMSETLGIGDSYNDLPMLEVCGTSYVMKNADEKIAPHLPRTEFSNDEDGVAKLIELLL